MSRSTTHQSVEQIRPFQRPGTIERWLNRLVTLLVGLGVGFRDNQVLGVRGRKTGKAYRTVVNVMEHEGRRYLVAPRGRTGWVRNAEVAGSVTLQRGKQRGVFEVREVPAAQRAPLLRDYLGRYTPSVKGFFSVAPDAPLGEFERVAGSHPVFELRAAQ